MSLVTSSIPNLINGVSQQPYALRLSSQCEEQINAHSSVVEGLRKRPPTKFKFSFPASTNDEKRILIHQINRDTSERYQVIFTNNNIRVFDLLGEREVAVRFPDGRAYLNVAEPATELRALTVADYTFVLNRNMVARSLPDKVAKYRPEAMIWVRQGAYGSRYRITINGTTVGFKTPDEAKGSKSRYEDGSSTLTGYMAEPPRERPDTLTNQYAATEYIAEKLYDLLRLNPTLGPAFEFVLQGSVIRIRSKIKNGAYPDFTLNCTDSQGDTVLKGYKDICQNFTDLPAKAFNGFRVKVAGDGSTEFDDYYVRYEGSATGGVWIEDMASDQIYKLDPATMPHALIRKEDGTFSFERLDWEPRKVGDDISNPLPSFVDKKLRDIFFYRNRLGVIAQENVIMSRNGDFYNFFRSSATQVLDTDPIDVAVSHVKVSDLNHAIPYNETLVLFAQGVQFQIAKAELLTPKTIAVNQTTEFDCSAAVKPVGVGPYLYFPYDRGGYGAVREYLVDPENAADDANEVTAHVPKYLKGNINFLAASPTEDMLVALTDANPSVAFVYKFFWSGDNKLQAAWSKWDFGSACNVLSAHFIGSVLWLSILRGNTITIESMDLSPNTVDADMGFMVHLDRRFGHEDELPTYNPMTNVTHITLPYPFQEGMQVVARNGNEGWRVGEVVPYTLTGENRLQIVGRLEYFFVGVPYTMRYRFSTITMKTADESGAQKAVIDGRLQLRKMTLSYSDSGFFRVQVTPYRRDTFTYEFTAKTVGLATTRFGKTRIESGKFNFPIQSKNDQVTIEITNETYLPTSLLGAEWEAIYTSRARRV